MSTITSLKPDVALGQVFDLADTNKNGSLTSTEVVQMLRVVKPSATEKEAYAFFGQTDSDKSGTISKDEFVKHFQAAFKGEEKELNGRIEMTRKFLARKPALVNVFNRYDVDGSGELDTAELYGMIKLVQGGDSTLETLEKMMGALDINRDASVSQDEFVNFYFRLYQDTPDLEFNDRIQTSLQGRRKVKLRMLFNAYDRDGNEELDVKEFASMMTLRGLRKDVDADTIITKMCEADSNKDRKVSYKEWLQYMAQVAGTWDDDKFNKAITNMINAAKK